MELSQLQKLLHHTLMDVGFPSRVAEEHAAKMAPLLLEKMLAYIPDRPDVVVIMEG